MNSCMEYASRIPLYVDGELTPEESEALFVHIEDCPDCQKLLEEMEAASARIRRSKPQLKAPDHLRTSILRRINASQAPSGPPTLVTKPARKLPYWSMSAVAASLLLAVGAMSLYHRSENHTELMLQTAVKTHRLLEQNALALDVSTDSPQTLANWFGDKLSFPFRMADDGMATHNRDRYRLAGGRLMTIGQDRVALLSFQLPDEVISLIVAPGGFITPSGNNHVQSAGIDLYSHEKEGLHIVTWKNRGLSYLLTSRSQMNDARQCSSCHYTSPQEKPTTQAQASLDGKTALALSRWTTSASRVLPH